MSENKIKWPCNRLIYETDGEKKDLCPKCGSSFRRKFTLGIHFWRTDKCIQPECNNYYDKEK